MNIIVSVILFLIIFAGMVCLYAGISAIVAYVLMLLWNFVVVSMNAPNLQLSFYVTWAIWFIITIIAGPFRSSKSSK